MKKILLPLTAVAAFAVIAAANIKIAAALAIMIVFFSGIFATCLLYTSDAADE